MQTRILLFLALFCCQFSLQSQSNNFWKTIKSTEFPLVNEEKRNGAPAHFHAFELDYPQLEAYLQKAPVEDLSNKNQEGLELTIPVDRGQLKTFKMVESSVMRPGLAAKYPSIQSYIGRSADGWYARIDVSINGFHGMVLKGGTAVYIDPYAKGQQSHYMSYTLREAMPFGFKFTCGAEDHEVNGHDHPLTGMEINTDTKPRNAEKSGCDPVEILFYDMALACVGE